MGHTEFLEGVPLAYFAQDWRKNSLHQLSRREQCSGASQFLIRREAVHTQNRCDKSLPHRLVRVLSARRGLGAGDKFIELSFRKPRGLTDAISPLHRSV